MASAKGKANVTINIILARLRFGFRMQKTFPELQARRRQYTTCLELYWYQSRRKSASMMSRKLKATLLILLLCAVSTFAGIRGRGKYYGIVIFDRWDTCYLYSGIYLMYVSEKTKEGLRKYEGQSVVIDAKEVYQPINPGDALIGKYKFLGLAKSKNGQLDGLTLRVSPQFEDEGAPKFLVEIVNSRETSVSVSFASLALTLLGAKRDQMFSPSDGKSNAWITRQAFKRPSFIEDMFPRKSKYITWGDNDEFYFNIDATLPDAVQIQPNQTNVIPLSFHLPKGNYDFLCGYGGGVHEEKGLVSNIVAFTVDETGNAHVDALPVAVNKF